MAMAHSYAEQLPRKWEHVAYCTNYNNDFVTFRVGHNDLDITDWVGTPDMLVYELQCDLPSMVSGFVKRSCSSSGRGWATASIGMGTTISWTWQTATMTSSSPIVTPLTVFTRSSRCSPTTAILATRRTSTTRRFWNWRKRPVGGSSWRSTAGLTAGFWLEQDLKDKYQK